MKATLLAEAVSVLLILALAGCGKGFRMWSDTSEHQTTRSSGSNSAFSALYNKDCAGCHGADGQYGAATNLANPTYLAWIDDASLREVIAKGRAGTTMPGFAKSIGGDLSDQQVEIVIQGMRNSWSKEPALQGAPPYKAVNAGDPARGKQIYAADCARCHGQEGGPIGKAGSILNGTFLGLVSDQMLRTTAVTGRSDLGMPDYRTRVRGHVVSDEEITDVVAFVSAHRPKTPGSPYPQSETALPNGARRTP